MERRDNPEIDTEPQTSSGEPLDEGELPDADDFDDDEDDFDDEDEDEDES